MQSLFSPCQSYLSRIFQEIDPGCSGFLTHLVDAGFDAFKASDVNGGRVSDKYSGSFFLHKPDHSFNNDRMS